MISITLLSSNLAALRTALVARGIIALQPDGSYAGVKPGVEITWAAIPNPIVTALATGTPGQPGYVPPVMDTRKVYMVKLAQDALAADDNGSTPAANDPTPTFTRSKLAQWVLANSTPETITGADGQTFRTYKVSASLWVVDPRDAPAMGGWQ